MVRLMPRLRAFCVIMLAELVLVAAKIFGDHDGDVIGRLASPSP